MKAVARVDLEQLERVLRGEQHGMPFESIQALDVVLRHLPSMRYIHIIMVHTYCITIPWTGLNQR